MTELDTLLKYSRIMQSELGQGGFGGVDPDDVPEWSPDDAEDDAGDDEPVEKGG